MALSAAIAWEVRTSGADTNGGGFKAGASGTDWSQQDAAQYSVTDGVTNGTSTITSATANFGPDVVGNVIYVQGGTGSITAGWYEIISRTNATTIVVDRATGLTAGTGVTLKIGGALASPGLAAQVASVTGMNVWIKAGTYTLTTATAGSGGPILLLAGIRIRIEGYSVTRGDRAGRPIISAGAVTTISIITFISSVAQVIAHLKVDGNSGSGVTGITLIDSGNMLVDCEAVNCNQASQVGIVVGGGHVYRCKASACTVGFTVSNAGLIVRSWADGCVGNGFTLTSGARFIDCVASDNGGKGFSLGGANGLAAINCTADGNTSDGFETTGSARTMLFGCASMNNGGYGFNTTAFVIMQSCASYNNTSGRTNTAPLADMNPITLSGDPWIDAANDDYRPDDTASEGALLRAISYIGVHGQTDNRDVGAVHHTDPTGGGGSTVIQRRIFN